jgi:hypothetical protein
MGTELNRVLESVMTRWVRVPCRALEPAEREVVCGDLAEAGEDGWRALREVLSLVVRRRVLNLEIARYCVPICVLTIPAALLLTLLAMRIADGSAIYLWMWINNSDWAILQSAGFWNTVLEFAPGLLFSYVTLACCSWTCGLLLGWSSWRTRWLSALLLLATVVSIAACGLPDALGHTLVLQSARDYHGNAAVFLEPFYRRVFPGAIELFLVMLPALWGMHQSSSIRQFARPARFLMLSLCSGVLGSLVGQNLVWSWIHGGPDGLYAARQGWGFWFAQLTVSVPIAYFFLTVSRRLGRRWAGTG